MLTKETIEVIKSTVPVLEAHGTTITSVFYKKLFENHPELLNIFNHANQRQGRQQTALANAVYAAAVHIERLKDILPVVKQIGEKHRALGILPEHYPIVGTTLLAALKEVLGDAATPVILNAWAEAYQVIADVFINIEADMYEKAASVPGGWSGFRRFIIDRKVEESSVISSFYLVPEDGKEVSDYNAGQYITLRVKPEGDSYFHLRHYSLSTAPGKPYYRITVKREDGVNGEGAGIVSTWLHRQAEEGTVIEVSAPAGSFTLNTDTELPLVLISGGVGLTPLLSMLETVLTRQPSRQVVYIHAAKCGSQQAMREHIHELTAKHPQLSSYIIYESPEQEDQCHKTGYIDLEFLQKTTDPGSDFYFCGPVPFMRAVYSHLKAMGVPAERTHYEFFGPAGAIED